LVAAVGIFAGGHDAAAQQPSQPSQPPPPPTTTLRIEVKGLHSSAGQVGCMIFATADGFPGKVEKAAGRAWIPIANQTAICEFPGLRPGRYAAVAMHDENGNGKLDTNLFGVPKEGVGASRDARPGFMRGPRFEDAALPFDAGTATIAINIRY
jgi:uncharacterized protein (DUF2141 family)